MFKITITNEDVPFVKLVAYRDGYSVQFNIVSCFLRRYHRSTSWQEGKRTVVSLQKHRWFDYCYQKSRRNYTEVIVFLRERPIFD